MSSRRGAKSRVIAALAPPAARQRIISPWKSERQTP
jgi:hypothetical protein